MFSCSSVVANMNINPIVISGISGSYPDARNVKEFGEKLNAKIELVNNDGRRWTIVHPEICNYTGKIHDLEKFDAGYFGVHYRQNKTMDPMMRIFLEKSVEAIFDAGVNPKELEGTRTGVFAGVCYSESEESWVRQNLISDHFSAIGCQKSIFTNRLSYYLKLKGPSHTTDTACSSSLFALEHAVRAIRSGECDKAIVGGCNLCLHPYVSLQFSRLGVLNKDGKCKTFDETADGYTRSETIAVVFLQKADAARRIYCELVHAKTNCDGYKEEGITFPSSEVQENLMKEVYAECGVNPLDLSYLEAHGTGTFVGDPQELEAISRTFLDGRNRPLLMGSIKSNIGHTEPSSGVASLTKAILAMETGLIPPNLHYNTPRKGIEGLHNGKFKIVTEPTPFEDDHGLIGVNSFGFGGGNCHALLRWNSKKKVNGGKPKDDLPRLVCVSGRNEKAVEKVLDELKSTPLDAEYISLFHEIFKTDVPEHLFRGFSILSKSGELLRSTTYVKDKTRPKYLAITTFGSHWGEVFNDLKNLEPFKVSIGKIEKASTKVGLLITGNPTPEVIGSAILQLAIIDTLKALNLHFDEVLRSGSLGEVLNNYLEGSVSLEDCLSFLKRFNDSNGHNFLKFTNLELNKDPRAQNLTIFEIGKNQLQVGPNDQIDVLTCDNFLSFLKSLGKLFEIGHDPKLSELYPKIEYPVSRGTPMISQLIQWNHEEDWFVTHYETEGMIANKSLENTVFIALDTEQFDHVKGHVIDGRVLFPATGYLFLVWEIFAENHGMMIDDVPIIFENCKFQRPLTFSKAKLTDIDIMIQKGTGTFEITQNDVHLVTGRIRIPKSDEELQFIKLPNEDQDDEEDSGIKLTTKDVYKELRLRGYNYKNLFRGIAECNASLTKAKITWHKKWVTFLDNMLQVKILQLDSRLLYVPTEIRQLIINPRKQWEIISDLGENPQIPITIDKKFDVIKSGAIQISGLGARSIPRRKPTAFPLIEKYQFVPNIAKLSLRESAKVNTQIVLENLPAFRIKVVELVDEEAKEENEFLTPLLFDVLSNLPLIQPDCIILTKRQDLNVDNVTVTITDKGLSAETECSIVVVRNALQDVDILRQALRALKPSAFVISRESLDSILSPDAKVDILTIHTTETERLVLIREKMNMEAPKVINVTSKNYSWVEELKSSLENEKSVLIVTQNPNSGILGLVNCLRREQSGDKIRCVFIQDQAPRFDYEDPFYSNQLKLGLVFNVFKNREWGSYRHLDLDEQAEIETEHSYLATLDRGDLSSMRWVEGPLKAKDQLEGNWKLIHIYYSSLNFRDVMSATGRISVDVFVRDRRLQDNIQGLEYAGRTSEGKRVMGGVIGGAMSTLVAADVHFMADVPDHWTLEDAATVPTVYCTVLYAFLIVNRIKKGDKILIHSGTGGIGLSAITVAFYYGCEVFTTVGSQEKRDFLKNHFPQLRDDHIGNSRDISFEQMVMDRTNGQGVDFVLNSLVEEKLEASVRCLARGGRFLEIGKFDIGNNKPLQLLFLQKEASFHGIMLDNIVLGEPELKQRLIRTFKENIDNDAIKPLPRTIFKEDQAEQAFRHMTTGKHIGKVLLQMRVEETDRQAIPTPRIMKAIPKYWCNPNKSYVIAGGLGGFGMELADWLVLRGARKLVLTSRRGISTGYQTYRINIWKSYGVQVEVFTDDITSKSGCETILKKASNLGPIDAIFNLAVVLKDAAFENQTPETFAESAKPKADATQHLDELSRQLCPNLRSFVVFSSVSCGRGNPGQSNYGMSNSVMERICEKRRSEGLPGLAIQWGAIGEVGLVADMQEENVEIEIGGTLQQKIANCLEVLDRLLNQTNPIVSSMVVSENRRTQTAADNVLDAVANIIGVKDLKTVSHHATLSELGMDSMSGVELKQTLERDFDIVLTPQDLRSMTLDKLKQLEEAKTAEQAPLTEEELKQQQIQISDILDKFTNDEAIARLPYVDLETKAPEDEERLVILFPGIEGVDKVLESLASNLKYKASCIHYDLDDPPTTIKSLSQRVLPVVKNLIKNKEFRIIGYSFGALVALEVVSMLEEEGYTGTLVCIDGTPLVITGTSRKMFDFSSTAHLQTGVIVHLTNFNLNKAFNMKERARIFQCTTFEERIELSMSMLTTNISQHAIAYMKAVSLASYHRFKGLETYQPTYKKIKCGVKLYKASELMDATAPEHYGLADLCENLLSVDQFEGNHTTVLENAKLADRINEDFDALVQSRLICEERPFSHAQSR